MKRIKYRKVRKVQPNYFEYNGIYKTEPVKMQLFIYNEEKYAEYENISIKEIQEYFAVPDSDNTIKWLNVHGLHDVELIKQLTELFNLESFIAGDILNTSRRTKMEEMDDVLFFSIKSILPEEENGNVATEQISFLLKGNMILSFQEKKSDYFTHIRERIRTGVGITRKKRNDFLLYMMLDAIMENFFITIEKYEDRIEELAVEAKTNYNADFITKIENNRENLNFIKRSLNPLKESLYNLKTVEEDEEYHIILKTSSMYFARLHQKSLEVLDHVEYSLNSLESVSNFHYSAQNQRMNQIMKTLTIFSVIFMPLTFIVGVYGMNFENIPELRSHNGYFIVLAVMAAIAIGMTIYFERKKWF